MIFGLVPVTNPVATAYFKTLVGLKSRNAVILKLPHAVLGVGNRVGELIHEVLREEGAPEDLVLWVKKRGSRESLTQQFMSHPDVGLVLATGGAAMVQAAYKPRYAGARGRPRERSVLDRTRRRPRHGGGP